MGEENKNVKKPAVSNTVVKKRPAGTGTKSTGNTRPGNGTKNTGSARSNSGTRSTNGTRPSNGTKNTSGTRSGGSGTRSAGNAHSNRTGSGAKIPQSEAMEVVQETPTHVQITHQEESHSHKKKTQKNNGKSVYIAACSCCRHYSAFCGKWHYAWSLSEGKADFKRICTGFEI